MSHKHSFYENLYISLADFKYLFHKNRYKILFSALSLGILMCLFSLIKPVEFTIEGTFREKAKSSAGIASSLTAAIIGSSFNGSESEALVAMKSRKLLEQVVKKLDLQAVVLPKKGFIRFPFKEKIEQRLTNFKDNFSVQVAYWKDSRFPSLENLPIPALEAVSVQYAGEVPLFVNISFINEEEFTIQDGAYNSIGQGTVGLPIQLDNCSFTLVKRNEEQLENKNWIVCIHPMPTMTGILQYYLTIEPDRLHKNILRISFQHRDRFLGVKIINTLMDIYQQYLQDEQSRLADGQIDYLKKRQSEIDSSLKEMIDEYAKVMSHDLSNTGFPKIENAFEFYSNIQNTYKHKLFKMDLEEKRLLKVKQDGYVRYEPDPSQDGPGVINHLLAEIRNLNQQSDSLEIALREASEREQQDKDHNFEESLARVDDFQSKIALIDTYVKRLNEGTFQEPPKELLEDSRYIVKLWVNKLNCFADEKEPPFYHCLEQFQAYLQSLRHYFVARIEMAKELLTFQQQEQPSFKGINLNTAKDLYVIYIRQRDDLEAKSVQYNFLIQHMDLPEFEISSLSSILDDHVSQKMVAATSDLVLALKDENNRSHKEQERLKEQLAVQKGFLKMHLLQTIQVLQLQKDLLQQKILSVQSATLGLTRQQITILENQIKEYINSRLKDIKLERFAIENHQEQLIKEMAYLPYNWVKEKLINQQLEVSQRMIEEVTRLVESKNIASNLETIQSAPLDRPVPPIHPKSPRLIFYAVLGAFLGTLFSYSWFVAKAMIQGVPVSLENLKVSGFSVAGSLDKTFNQQTKHLAENDLDTLRQLVHSLLSPQLELKKDGVKGGSIAIAKGQTRDFSTQLAALLVRRGFSVLLINLSMQASSRSEVGLIQALEGKIIEPAVTAHKEGYDTIEAGGVDRYIVERLNSLQFNALKEAYLKRYDWIIVLTDAEPRSAEAKSLLNQFDRLILSVSTETLNELMTYLDPEINAKALFVFNPNDLAHTLK